jgi:ribonuclease HI
VYAGAAWHPWISATNLDKLEGVQRYACRAISGQVRSTPSDATTLETDLPLIKERSRVIAVTAYEKSLRLDHNPRHTLATADNIRRTKKTDWRDHARGAWRDLFDEAPMPFPQLQPPWDEGTDTTFAEAAEKKSTSDATNLEASERALTQDAESYDLTIYTDGSAVDSNRDGGAGILITTKDDETTTELAFPAGRLTSSFQAEMVAIKHALQAVGEMGGNMRARIVTDSKSSVERLKGILRGDRLKSQTEAAIWDSLRHLKTANISLHLLWCPSHCGLWGNEEADRLAGEGSLLQQENIELTFDTAKAAIRRQLREKRTQTTHELLRDVYYDDKKKKINLQEDNKLSRQEQVQIARLRCGHHPELGYWMKKIGQETPDGCRLCGMDEEETTEHVMIVCPGVHDVRPGNWALSDLTRRPQDALLIWDTWRARIKDT